MLFLSSGPIGPDCVESRNLITCELGSLQAGERFTFTIKVAPSSEGTITNTAQVTGFEADPQISNNNATESVEFVLATKPPSPAPIPVRAEIISPTQVPVQIPTLIPAATEVPAPPATLQPEPTPGAPPEFQVFEQVNSRMILVFAIVGVPLLFLLSGLFYFLAKRRRRRVREEPR